MLISDNVLNVLAAKTYNGIGRKWINDNLRGGMTERQVVDLLNKKGIEETVRGFALTKMSVRSKIDALGSAVDGVVGLGDTEFPSGSSQVKAADRPIAFFYRGDISLLRNVADNVAVIGLLTPDEAIRADEENLVTGLLRQGKCIVSGLALGCDTVGHETAVKNVGKTVAFLSSPLTEVNPPSNRPLADEIVANGGLLVSEYYEKAHSRSEFLGRYPERDRLQAMFAGAVVLAASYSQADFGKDSGSRFAMGKAAEYGVPRYVMYNAERDSSNPMFNLSREEIRTGAKIVVPTDADKIVPAKTSAQLELAI